MIHIASLMCIFYTGFPQQYALTYVAKKLYDYIDHGIYYNFHRSPLYNTLFGHLGSDHIFYVKTHFCNFVCTLHPKQSPF
jgi:hypothetical protein